MEASSPSSTSSIFPSATASRSRSSGQQQRVAVARALANRPTLVLADEPTGALDVNNAQQVLALIRTLCEEVKASLLLVSHDLAITNQFPRVVTLAELNRAGPAI